LVAMGEDFWCGGLAWRCLPNVAVCLMLESARRHSLLDAARWADGRRSLRMARRYALRWRETSKMM
jgi:hypothetical protein